MENMESTVSNVSEATEADQLPEGLVEETDESEMSLEEAVGETVETEQAAEEQPSEAEPETPPAREPGYVKQRVEKAVARATAETEARLRAEFDQRMAPIMERLLVEDAKELVREGKIKDLETAKEYLRMKQGLPTSAADTPKDQPRNANGQFAPKQDDGDIATQTRIDMLRRQAEKIKTKRGVDVIAEFNNNPDIKQRVIAGEIDFYDVADMMSESKRGRKPPSPMRSPNGASGSSQPNAITNMSDEQFERMEKRIREGARYSLK